jgi:hypothetical protein
MRHLEVAARSFLLPLLLLNSEDGGAQESSQDELRKHNEDELMRKEMQSTVYGCGLESSSYSGVQWQLQGTERRQKRLDILGGRLCKAWRSCRHSIELGMQLPGGIQGTGPWSNNVA